MFLRVHARAHTHTHVQVHTWEKSIERETENLKQAPGSELSAQSPTQSLNSQAVRS